MKKILSVLASPFRSAGAWLSMNRVAILFLLMPVTVLYACAAFIAWSFNPAEWHAVGRLVLSILTVLGTLLIADKLFK